MSALVRVFALAAAVQLSTVAPAAGSAPVNTSPPHITGSPLAGETLSVAFGTWAGTGLITYTIQWLRCDAGGSGCALIAGATANTYTVGPADAGGTLRARVTARNADGSASATTAAFAIAVPSTTTLPSATTTTTLPPQGAEVCANCLDDDGDGLVDDADPACCPDPATLQVRRARFRDERLRLRARIGGFAAVDPTAAPVRVQIAGSGGTVVCTPLGPWTRKRRSFRFRGSVAGLRRGTLRPRRRRAALSLDGRKVDLGGLTGPELAVTLRVGALCAHGRAPLRQKGRRLIAP